MKLVLITVDETTSAEAIKNASVAFAKELKSACKVNILDKQDLAIEDSEARLKSILCDIIGSCKAGPDFKTTFWQFVSQGKLPNTALAEILDHPKATKAILKELNRQELMELIYAYDKIKNLM